MAAARLLPCVVVVAIGVFAIRANAQSLPAGPARALGGDLTVGAEVVGTFSDKDEIGFFNYTDYERNALRMFRIDVSSAWQPGARFALVGDVRAQDGDNLHLHAAFVRIRPWALRAFDIQAGRIPSSFGAFSRRAYSTDNVVIGYPLAYQYLSSLRPDAAALTVDDLLRMRGRGWRPTYPVGSKSVAPGVPLVTAYRLDTGVQARWAHPAWEVTGSVTNGTLSNPRVSDDNGGKQLLGRVLLTPKPGLKLGASAARGQWAADSLPNARNSTQTALGWDAEYSRDHWLVRTEWVAIRWTLPYSLPPSGVTSLRALGGWVEGRYRFAPRIFAAARVDRLGFSRVTGTLFEGAPTAWDAPVEREELAVGYYLQRNLIARFGVQTNRRDAGRLRSRTFLAAQIIYWF